MPSIDSSSDADSELSIYSPQRAQTFPTLESWYVQRAALLSTLAARFKAGDKVLFVEEQQGFGKTLLAAQFALANPMRTICLFLNPDDTLLCAPDSLRRDVYAQAYRLLNGAEPDGKLLVDEGDIRTVLQQLHSYARAKRHNILFVIDGMHTVDNDSFLAG